MRAGLGTVAVLGRDGTRFRSTGDCTDSLLSDSNGLDRRELADGAVADGFEEAVWP